MKAECSEHRLQTVQLAAARAAALLASGPELPVRWGQKLSVYQPELLIRLGQKLAASLPGPLVRLGQKLAVQRPLVKDPILSATHQVPAGISGSLCWLE